MQSQRDPEERCNEQWLPTIFVRTQCRWVRPVVRRHTSWQPESLALSVMDDGVRAMLLSESCGITNSVSDGCNKRKYPKTGENGGNRCKDSRRRTVRYGKMVGEGKGLSRFGRVGQQSRGDVGRCWPRDAAESGIWIWVGGQSSRTLEQSDLGRVVGASTRRVPSPTASD